MGTKLVDICLTVELNGNSIIAHLLFSNNTSNNIYLDRLTICFNNRVRNDYFKIKDEKNREVNYKGIMMKRDVEPEDFITLNPGDTIKTSITLNEVYELKKGKKYNIQYYTNHPSYLDEQGFTKIQSNKVEVVY